MSFYPYRFRSENGTTYVYRVDHSVVEYRTLNPETYIIRLASEYWSERFHMDDSTLRMFEAIPTLAARERIEKENQSWK